MPAFTNPRTSPSCIPLTCALALALVAPPVAAGPLRGIAIADFGGGLGPVLADMSFAPAATAPTSEPARASTPCPAAQEAIAGASADKYAAAARHYETCARSSGDAGLWKKAGMARYSGRQYAHAIQALDRYLQSSPGGGDAQGEAMLEDARKNAATVRFSVVTAPGATLPEALRVMPRGGVAGDEIDLPWSRSAVSFDVWLDPGQWTAELRLPGGGRVGPQDIQAVRDVSAPQVVLFRVEAPAKPLASEPATAGPVEVELSLGPGAALRRGIEVVWRGPAEKQGQVRTASSRWPLTPGEWQLGLRAGRFEPQTRVVQVRAGEPHSLKLMLVRSREDKLRIGLAAGLGGVAVGMLAGGVAVALGGRRDYRNAVAGLDGTPDEASVAAGSAALAATGKSSNGTIVATAGAGIGLAAITVAAGGNDKLLGVEIGVGGALLIAGIAWLVPAKRRYTSDVPEDAGPWSPDKGYLDKHRVPELAAASLIGLGAGLAAGATVALVARKLVGRSRPRARSTTVSPMTAPRAIGLSLQGTF